MNRAENNERGQTTETRELKRRESVTPFSGVRSRSSVALALGRRRSRTASLQTRRSQFSCIAPDDNRPPKIKYRLLVLPLVFIPWLLLYEFVVYRGPASSAFTTYLPGEWG